MIEQSQMKDRSKNSRKPIEIAPDTVSIGIFSLYATACATFVYRP